MVIAADGRHIGLFGDGPGPTALRTTRFGDDVRITDVDDPAPRAISTAVPDDEAGLAGLAVSREIRHDFPEPYGTPITVTGLPALHLLGDDTRYRDGEEHRTWQVPLDRARFEVPADEAEYRLVSTEITTEYTFASGPGAGPARSSPRPPAPGRRRGRRGAGQAVGGQGERHGDMDGTFTGRAQAEGRFARIRDAVPRAAGVRGLRRPVAGGLTCC
ncbi:hypothetical protein RM780_24640 [Streptomyces sp. DSM 44917]|uniref:Uncharacterized protein n=1 Tax=Streptomyces boetiae TaxID=3075541 RepID=A0ABU2LG33_9ACTN|nr:hypothetical protein [Streptomyces sp. DSM 44917]MDT0310118.1 hypothetical protein [Streptomyces sp. DSM 44917]